MLTAQQFQENDALDRQRTFLVIQGLAGAALGVDPGYAPYDGQPLTTQRGFNVLSVSTGSAPQGQAGNVTAKVGDFQITLPMLLVVGAAAWLILRK